MNFYNLFMLPILFALGPFAIYSFGLILAVGFIISLFIIYQEAKKEYLDEEKVFDVVFICLFASLIGARLFYIIEHFDAFGFSPLNWILINAKPGMSLWGGIGIGLAVFLLSLKKKKLPLYKMLEIITVPVSLLFVFGEMGSFLAGTEIGRPTNLPWGVIYFSTLKRHPVGLYRALSSLLVLLILLKLRPVYNKKRVPTGSLFYTFVLIESLLFFLITFFKEDVLLITNTFEIDHLVYFSLFITGGILLYKRIGRSFKSDLLLLRTKLFKPKQKKN